MNSMSKSEEAFKTLAIAESAVKESRLALAGDGLAAENDKMMDFETGISGRHCFFFLSILPKYHR